MKLTMISNFHQPQSLIEASNLGPLCPKLAALTTRPRIHIYFLYIDWTSWGEWTLQGPACGDFTEKRWRKCMRDTPYSSNKTMDARPDHCKPLKREDENGKTIIKDWMSRINKTDIPCLGMFS